MNELERILEHEFAEPGLMQQALRHPSYVAEHAREGDDNQRMEFLGDAVLQLGLSAILYERFPDLDEGPLTRLRTIAVRTEALAEFAIELDLGRFLLLGRGEEKNGGRGRASNLADAFEAILAALYLDGGESAAFPLCERLAESVVRGHPEQLLAMENPKGALQEWVAAREQDPPDYEVESVTGPEHDPRFQVAVRLEGTVAGRAVACSRKEAEKAAAAQALKLVAEAPLGTPGPSLSRKG